MEGKQFSHDLLLGLTSGVISKTLMYPSEKYKLLLTIPHAISTDPVVQRRLYSARGWRFHVNFIRHLVKEGGVGIFWRGNAVKVLSFAPHQGFAVALNDFFKAILPRKDKNKEFGMFFTHNLVAGGLSGVTSVVVCYPVDLALTLWRDTRVWNNRETLFKTAKEDPGLYRFRPIALAGTSIYRACQLGLFATFMDWNSYAKDKGTLGFGSTFLCSFAACSVSEVVSYPIDTVRRRLMINVPSAKRLYDSGFHCVGHIVKNEGVASLYKGLFPSFLRGLSGALVLVLYNRLQFCY